MTGVVVPITFCIVAVLGFIGNVLVISVVLSNSRMRNTTNALIINLAIADLLFIVICVPFTAVSFATSLWPFGSLWCKTYNYAINVTAYVSVYTLVLMALDRYLAVVHPIESLAHRTERNACVVIGVVWLVMCTLNIPVWLHHDVLEYKRFQSVEELVPSDDGNVSEWRTVTLKSSKCLNIDFYEVVNNASQVIQKAKVRLRYLYTISHPSV